ncbi:ricin-type beta-trefoil lectin domain protein [Myxococcus sp. K15C18031901]|uniref:ricin-type beta-trefoil lectin domain protein n=1 Tax=Myxococcus dinghuensis TaxID=2906761 RepID=UPI0020A76597|nr:ricin-type beta-trefoil lectin domain protein [Myxococcus dinghuensis]MCP3099193.1 ricin-type beta-trefoil lectin domain protein [Myxococcus dinghuensis]
MARKLPLFSTATALLAGVVSVQLAPAVVFAAPSDDAASVGEVSPEVLGAMQRDLGLTESQARRRLAAEAVAVRTEQTLRQDLGASFGGAWMSDEGDRLIVGVTDAAGAAAARRAGAEPRWVLRTERQLDALKSSLDRGAALAGKDIHGWYVDVMTNTVVVLAKDSAVQNAERFVADSGAADSAVRVLVSNEEPRPLYDTRGGDAYYINGNTRCSIGLPVAGGFVTAGHCGGVGSTTQGHNGAAQGTVRGSSFPTNDYGWVQTNGSWVSQPWVYNYAGANVLVFGSAEAGVNASVCRSGSTTGWRCGVIQAKNVTVNYSVGPVYGLTQTNACAEGGDSGGSWMSGNQAQGVTSGGSGNCSTGGNTFFQPVNPILSVYGLSLTTTNGGRPLVGLAGKCIDVDHSNTANGTPIQLWDCNGTDAQKWTFHGDGTLRAFGKCMDVTWGSTANGALIQLHDCTGNPAQQFVLSGAGDLVNPQANKCVDVQDFNSNNGTRLQIWECAGTANQKWSVR